MSGPPPETIESILANGLQILHAIAYLQPLGSHVVLPREMLARLIEDLTVCLAVLRHEGS